MEYGKQLNQRELMTLRELLEKTGDKYEYRPKHLLNGATVEMQRHETEYWHVTDYAVSSRVGNTLFMVKREIEVGKEQGHAAWNCCKAPMFAHWIIGPVVKLSDGSSDIAESATASNESDARFICKAVNCHDELVNALKSCQSNMRVLAKAAGQFHPNSVYVDADNAAQAILAKARGEK